MTADPRALTELLEESQDLQADALRPTHEALDELVETQRTRPTTRTRRRTRRSTTSTSARLAASLGGTTLLGAAGGAALVGAARLGRRRQRARATCRSSRPPPPSRTWPSPPTRRPSRCPTSGDRAANPVVTKFAQVTMGQHVQHDDAFTAAVKQPGRQGPEQASIRPSCRWSTRRSSRVSARDPVGRSTAAWSPWPLSSRTSRPRPTSRTRCWPSRPRTRLCSPRIMGIEAQHVSVLLAVQALLQGRRPAADLPRPRHRRHAARRGRQCRLPQCLLQDQQAAPARQGAVK